VACRATDGAGNVSAVASEEVDVRRSPPGAAAPSPQGGAQAGPAGEPAPAPTVGPGTLALHVRRVRVDPRRGRLALVVDVSAPARLELRLVRRGATLRQRERDVQAGERRLSLRLPRQARTGGRLLLVVEAVAADGRAVKQVPVRVPRAPRR
jgi:hypothetical protein